MREPRERENLVRKLIMIMKAARFMPIFALGVKNKYHRLSEQESNIDLMFPLTGLGNRLYHFLYQPVSRPK